MRQIIKRYLAGWLLAAGCALGAAQGQSRAATPAAADAGARLTILAAAHQRSWTRAQLLADPRLAPVTLDDDNFKRRMTVLAIPMTALLDGLPIPPGASATLVASDGYISHMPMGLLLTSEPDAPRAYLAVENPAAPWPQLEGHDIGPFRLVWTLPADRAHGAGASINQSYWTYSIERIEAIASPAERFPAIRPAADVPAHGAIMRGFAVFQRACFSCHSLNGAGDSHLGPDLNVPFNPVEYLGDARLTRYIRNPQSLRWWPNARMPGIDRATVSDAQLRDLLAYLHHMAGRKIPAPPSPGG